MSTLGCNHCLGVATKMCSGCQSTYYCSHECQEADWQAHKQACVNGGLLGVEMGLRARKKLNALKDKRDGYIKLAILNFAEKLVPIYGEAGGSDEARKGNETQTQNRLKEVEAYLKEIFKLEKSEGFTEKPDQMVAFAKSSGLKFGKIEKTKMQMRIILRKNEWGSLEDDKKRDILNNVYRQVQLQLALKEAMANAQLRSGWSMTDVDRYYNEAVENIYSFLPYELSFIGDGQSNALPKKAATEWLASIKGMAKNLKDGKKPKKLKEKALKRLTAEEVDERTLREYMFVTIPSIVDKKKKLKNKEKNAQKAQVREFPALLTKTVIPGLKKLFDEFKAKDIKF